MKKTYLADIGVQMMRVAVCDDQPEILQEMQELLLKEEDIRKVDIYSDIEIFFCMVNEEKEYDVVFMDIDWKAEKTGIDFARQLYQSCPYTKLVYITSYTLEYVEDIFLGQSNLSGFLTKPVRIEQLKKIFDKIQRETQEDGGKLLIKRQGGMLAIPFSEIRYLENRLHKTYIYTMRQECQCGENMETLKQQLDQRFLNCHKSYIVNLSQIERIEDKLILKNGEILPIARRRKSELLKRFMQYDLRYR